MNVILFCEDYLAIIKKPIGKGFYRGNQCNANSRLTYKVPSEFFSVTSSTAHKTNTSTLQYTHSLPFLISPRGVMPYTYLYFKKLSFNEKDIIRDSSEKKKKKKKVRVCGLKVCRQDFLHTHQCQFKVKLYRISAHMQKSILNSGIDQSDSPEERHNSLLHHFIPYSSINETTLTKGFSTSQETNHYLSSADQYCPDTFSHSFQTALSLSAITELYS